MAFVVVGARLGPGAAIEEDRAFEVGQCFGGQDGIESHPDRIARL